MLLFTLFIQFSANYVKEKGVDVLKQNYPPASVKCNNKLVSVFNPFVSP